MSESKSSIYADGVKDIGNLVVRTLGIDRKRIESYLPRISKITGLDSYHLAQRYLGYGVALLDRSPDLTMVAGRAEALSSTGFPAALVLTSELRALPPAYRAAGVRIDDDRIAFLNRDGKELGAFSRGDKGLFVLGDLGSARRDIASLLLASSGAPSPEKLKPETRALSICSGRPYFDILVKGSSQRFRIVAERTNFNELGERRTPSRAQNMLVILKSLVELAADFDLDLEFGGTPFPRVLTPLADSDRAIDFHFPGDDREREFDVHSRYLACAYAADLFNIGRADERPSLEKPAEVILPGELEKMEDEPAETEDDRAVGPIELEKGESGYQPLSEKISVFLDAIGPKKFFIPLMLLTVFSSIFYMARPEYPAALLSAIFSLGALVGGHGFVIMARKRIIENIPTSRIRSMPLGRVEIAGKAQQKYRLKTPYSNLDCVYYKYTVGEKTSAAGLGGNASYSSYGFGIGGGWGVGLYSAAKSYRQSQGSRIIASGDSGRIPFYLEDDTGRVLIEPSGAQVMVTNTHKITRRVTPSGTFALPAGQVVTETYIPVGFHVYVYGHADRKVESVTERRRRVIEKLREIKADEARMRGYDTNGDGHIDEAEWAKAKQDAINEVMAEELNAPMTDTVTVSKRERQALFLITDQKEDKLLRGMRIEQLVSLILGAGIIVWGASILATLLGG